MAFTKFLEGTSETYFHIGNAWSFWMNNKKKQLKRIDRKACYDWLGYRPAKMIDWLPDHDSDRQERERDGWQIGMMMIIVTVKICLRIQSMGDFSPVVCCTCCCCCWTTDWVERNSVLLTVFLDSIEGVETTKLSIFFTKIKLHHALLLSKKLKVEQGKITN